MSHSQKEKLMEEYLNFLCANYGMGRPSDGNKNLVYSNIDEALNVITEIYVIDKDITETISKLKCLRSKRDKKRNSLLRLVRELEFQKENFQRVCLIISMVPE